MNRYAMKSSSKKTILGIFIGVLVIAVLAAIFVFVNRVYGWVDLGALSGASTSVSTSIASLL